MAIDFPTSPTVGQVYSYNGVTYVYTAQGVWATASASAVANVSQVGFRAHKNGVDQTGIFTGITTFTKVTFGTEDYDQGGYYDAPNSRWTPPAGLVHFDIVLYASVVGSGGQLNAVLYKNGVELKRGGLFTTQTVGMTQVSFDDVANGIDYYEIYVTHNTGVSTTLSGDVKLTYFSGHVTGGPPGPVGPSGSVVGAPPAPQGRLTLQTLTPVMTTTQAAKTTIYYTPYVGNRVPIYDGANTVMATFTELSVATTDTTKSPAAIGASKVNDWFVWSDAGTIRIGHGPDWTNDTTRSAGTALTMVNGILLNNASITNGPVAQRGTYVGTTRSNASLQIDWIPTPTPAAGGNPAALNVWNAYNRVLTIAAEVDTTSSWSYTGVERNSNNSINNRVNWVDGLGESWVVSEFCQTLDPADIAVALSSIQLSTGTMYVASGYNNNKAVTQVANGRILPAIGARFVQAREATSGANPVTFYGAVPYYMLAIMLEM